MWLSHMMSHHTFYLSPKLNENKIKAKKNKIKTSLLFIILILFIYFERVIRKIKLLKNGEIYCC